MKTVYERSIHENVTVDGQQWNSIQDTDCTTEFEPFDAKKKEEYNMLLPQLDELICSVAQKRKECPFLCVQQQAEECKYLHKEVMMRKTEVTSSVMPLPVRDTSANEARCQSKFKQICSATVPLLLIGPKILDDANKLTETLNVQSTFGRTCTDDALFRTENKVDNTSVSLRRSTRKHPSVKKSPSSLATKTLLQNRQTHIVLRKGYLKGRSK